MAMLLIRRELLERLEAAATKEGIDPSTLAENIIEHGLENYPAEVGVETDTGDIEHDPFESLIGILDTDETNLSTTVRDVRPTRLFDLSSGALPGTGTTPR